MPPPRARAPLDLDLEDHLIFGLTPVRFGYLAVGGLAAYALGGHAPGPLGLPIALLLLGGSAAFAWIRWHGRPLDAWLLDLAVHARRNLEVEIDPVVLRRIRAPLRRPAPLRMIAVAGSERGAGATTMATELSVALALKGRRVALRSHAAASHLQLDAGIHPASGLRAGPEVGDAECVVLDLGARLRARRADLGLMVVPGNRAPDELPVHRLAARHVEVIANRAEAGTGAHAHSIPEDHAVPQAQEAAAAVILQFPASPAALAFRRVADAVDPTRSHPWPAASSEAPPAG